MTNRQFGITLAVTSSASALVALALLSRCDMGPARPAPLPGGECLEYFGKYGTTEYCTTDEVLRICTPEGCLSVKLNKSP